MRHWILCVVSLIAAAAMAAEDPAKPPAPDLAVALPEIPFPKSDAFRGIRWLSNELRDRNGGDVWSTTWADDGNLYSVADDTQGWNLSIFKIEGTPPGHKVTRINEMQEYLQAGRGPWWKGAGMACIDGVLYLGIYSQSNPSKVSASKVSFNADHSSVIKSTDHGKTWSGSARDHLAKPMFPKKEFPTPFFVQYGKDYAGAMDEYVYLCSNDGGWNNWNRMMLARVPRKKFGTLDRADWEFFVAADAQNNPTWTADVNKTGSVFEHKLHTSMTGIQYVPAIKRFVMGQWSYVAMKGQGDRPCSDPALPQPWPEDAAHGRADQTMLCLYEAPKPWGPWKLIHAQASWGPSYYNPCFPAKWFEDGGKRLWIVQGGNYRGGGGGYQFITQPMEWNDASPLVKPAGNPPADGVYNIRDYGARGDGKTLDTAAINAAIAACAQGGGGTVIVPPGEYLSGTIRLQSNLTFHLEPGAVVKGSANPADYRLGEMTHAVPSTFHPEEYLRLGLVYAKDLTNIAITGRGALDGNGDAFMNPTEILDSRPSDTLHARQGARYVNRLPDGPLMPKKDAQGRRIRPGSMVLLHHCSNILIRDVTIRNSPNWSLHLAGCSNGDILGVTMHHSLLVPNSDSLDVGNCRDIRIAGCDLVSGDDCIALGACGDDFSHEPTENILVSNCRLTSRSAAIRVGFGNYDVRNCVFQNLVINDSNRGICVCVRGRQSIENVLFSHIVMQTRLHTGWWGHGEPIQVSALPGRAEPRLGRIRDLRFSNIIAEAETGIVVYGCEAGPIEDLLLDNVKLKIKNSPLNEAYGGNFDLRPAEDECYRVFEHDIPALYCGHVKRCTIRNFEVRWPDDRLPDFFNHAVHCQHFCGLSIDGFQGRQPHAGDRRAVIALDHGKGVMIRNSTAGEGAVVFLGQRDVSDQSLLFNNDLAAAKTAVEPNSSRCFLSGNRMPQ